MNHNRHTASNSARPYLIVVFLLLLCIPAISVICDITISDNSKAISRQVSSGGQVHYRFRRIYNGADMSYHRTNGGNVQNIPTYSGQSVDWNSATAVSGNTTALSFPMAANEGSASMSIHTSSSATMHSLGGGAAMGSIGNTGSTGKNQSMTTMPYASPSVPSFNRNPSRSTLLAQNTTTHSSQIAGGPRRAGEYIWGSTLYDENGDEIGTVDGDGNVWKDGVIVGTFHNGNFSTQGEAVDNPIGAPWILLLFSAIFTLYLYLRKKHTTLKTMKTHYLKIFAISLLSILSIGQTWGYTFPAGTTIYYDLTEYGSGANIYNAAGNEYGDWKENTSSIIAVTLTKDLEITSSSNLFKSGASNWNGVKADEPTEGQNMIISTDGKTASWGTYSVPTPIEYTIYFKNTVDWSNVYVHFYGSSYSMGGNGASGKNAAQNYGAMTQIGSSQYYSITFSSTQAYTKVCFTEDQQDGYDNFWQTEATYSDALDLSSSNLLWVPNSSSSVTKNENVPYYAGEWRTYPECVAGAFTIAQPGNGRVGDTFNMNPNITAGSGTITYTCSPEGAVSFDGNTATFESVANPVTITATLSGPSLCASVEKTTNSFLIEAALVNHNYGLVFQPDGWARHGMTDNSGTWTYTYTDVAAGTYSLAISSNNDGDGGVFDANKISNSDVTINTTNATVTKDGGGIDFNVTTAAVGNITISYNPTTKTLTVTAAEPAVAHTWKIYYQHSQDLGTFVATGNTDEYRLDAFELTTANHATLCFKMDDTYYIPGSGNLADGNQHNMGENQTGLFDWTGENYGLYTLTITKSGATWRVAAEERGATPITDAMVAPVYYIYLGEAFSLPAGYNYSSAALGTNTIADNTFTANQLGEYDVRVTKTGYTPKDIKVRVYRYYVKHAWGWSGTASTSNPQYNATWVWEPLSFIDATHAEYTGTGGNVVNNGANLCWDYTYDWAGVYQTDADNDCNFHPGLDNDSRQGKWNEGAHLCNGEAINATTGATTWKNIGTISQGTIYDFNFNETLSGSDAPSNNTSNLSVAVTSKTTYAVNFVVITNGEANNDGGYITTTLGTTSGLKALNNTVVTFTAHAQSGYFFKGWYSDAECTAKIGDATTLQQTVNGSDITVYAKYISINMYIHANWYGWNAPEEKYKFTKVSDYAYEYSIASLNVKDGGWNEFLIKDAEGAFLYTPSNSNLGTNVIKYTDNNFKLNFSGFCSIVIRVEIDAETGKATVSATYTRYPDVYICSNTTEFTQYDWGAGPCTKMTHTPGTNVYTYTHNCKTTAEVGFTFREKTELSSGLLFDGGTITETTKDSYVSYFNKGGVNHNFQLTEFRSVTITLTVAEDGTATIDLSTAAITGVYFVNSDNWTNVYAYAWSGDNNTAAWPGNAMTLAGQVTVEGDTYDYYFYPVSTGKIIFNNGEASGSANKRQTANQDVQVEKIFMAADKCYGDNGEPQPKTAWYDNISAVSAAHIGVCSGWYLHGSPFGGNWSAGTSEYPFNQVYREMENVYYRVVSFNNTDAKHFRVTDGTKTYSGNNSGSSNYVIAVDATIANLTANTSKSFEFVPIADHDYWFVVSTTDKKFWIQDPEEYHHIQVNETDANNYGDYTLTTTSSGNPANKATELFANGEHYLLTITVVNDKVTPNINVNGVEQTLTQNGNIYTYEGTMPDGDITIAITYDVTKDFTFQILNGVSSITEAIFGQSVTLDTSNPINFVSTPGFQYAYSIDGGSSWINLDVATYVINSFGNSNIIKFRARGSDDGFASYVEKTIDVTIPSANVTLSHSGNVSVGSAITLTATANISGGTYTFYVTAPGEAVATAVYSGHNNYYNYVLPVEGHYSLSVDVEDENTPHVYEMTANDAVDVTPHTYYLRYNFVNNAGDFNNRSENNVPMTYNSADGTYYYYHATVTNDGYYLPISSYDYLTNQKAAVMTSNREAVAADWKTIHNDEKPYVANNVLCVFHYDPNRDYVWITSAVTNYRVKSVGVNGTFYSNSIRTAQEKISFYASTDATLSWQTSADGGASWDDAGSISTHAASNGVWVATPASVDATTLSLSAYTGAYYVNNTALSNNKMTDFSSTSTTYYDHYCVAHLAASTNVGATLGNTINSNLSIRMPWYSLPIAANVRYEYKPATNAFTRTLISGSTTDEFAKIYGINNGEIYQVDGVTPVVKASALKLIDGSDWVYTADIKVTTTGSDVYAKLVGGYNGSQQWILAKTGEENAADAKALICGSGTTSGTYSFRLIYDYKTNKFISGWNPGDIDIPNDINMNANFFVIRGALNSSNLNFVNLNGHSVSILKSIIFVLDIDRDDLFNSDNSPKHDLASTLFQVTLPYNVTMGNIFGLPDYGTDWVIQDYKGELRKNIGYDGTSDFWATLLWNPATTLKQGRGYVVSTHFNYSDFREISGYAKKYLYFPSGEIAGGYSLSATIRDTVYNELRCTKAGREPYDSDWRAVGARSFYPTKMHTEGNDDGHTLDYFYEWNGSYGNYTAWALEDRVMQPTCNYLIQYHGKAQWTKYAAPSPVIARRAPEQNIVSNYRIELQTIAGEMIDQTYIKLSEDGNDEYVIGHDLTKSFTEEAPQIYSITAGNELAGNNVSDTTSFVALAISLPEADEYTITLGNYGQTKQAVLYDRQQDCFVNLSYGASYSFTGIAGKQTDRFYVRFATETPATPTEVDDILTAYISAVLLDGMLLINGLTADGPVLLYSPSGQLIYQAANNNTSSVSIPAPSAAGVYLIRCAEQTIRVLVK